MITSLVIRHVEPEVVLALEQRAALHGRSAEAEHHDILRNALQRPRRRSLAEVLASMPDLGEDGDFSGRHG